MVNIPPIEKKKRDFGGWIMIVLPTLLHVKKTCSSLFKYFLPVLLENKVIGLLFGSKKSLKLLNIKMNAHFSGELNKG